MGRGGKIVSDADRPKSGEFWLALSSNIVEDEPETGISQVESTPVPQQFQNLPEHVMLDEERVVGRLENEVLHEGLWNVLVRLVNLGKY